MNVLDNLIFFFWKFVFNKNFIFITRDDKFLTNLLQTPLWKKLNILRTFYLISKNDKIKQKSGKVYELHNIYFIKVSK